MTTEPEPKMGRKEKKCNFGQIVLKIVSEFFFQKNKFAPIQSVRNGESEACKLLSTRNEY